MYVIDECRLDIDLEPASRRLEATAALEVALKDKPGRATPGRLRLQLHGDLDIDAATCNNSAVAFRRLPAAAAPATMPTTAAADDSPAPPPASYEFDWRPAPGRADTLIIRYGGILRRDIRAGEKLSENHGLRSRNYIGEEGIYLSDSGIWYPQLPDAVAAEPSEECPLTRFELTATEPPGMVLVSSGIRDGAKFNAPRGPRTTWRMPFSARSIALVGGRRQVFQRQAGRVLLSVHAGEDHASFAPGLLDAVESCLRRYQPLIGDYPYVEFTVFEDSFGPDFASPGFVTIRSAVVARGPVGPASGHLDHGLLSNWWGHGVFSSALDGDWGASLTSYCADYMRPILEGRPDEARSLRRNICYDLSRRAPEDDRPLAAGGRAGGADAIISRRKGVMVFAMLADQLGQDTMWRALRRLREERLGRPTTWKDLQAAFEHESRQSLAAFFDAWVRAAGVPQLTLDGAEYDQRARRVAVPITQAGPRAFGLTVPVRLIYNDGFQDERISVDRPTQVALVRTMVPPDFVELDPDFRVLRRVPIECVMPSMSGIDGSKSVLIVRSDEDGSAYDPLADQIKGRYEKAGRTGVREIKDAELKPEDLQRDHVLLLGKACRAPAVAEALPAGPLKFVEGGFTVDGKRYARPTDEVLCCLRNEPDPGGVIGLYFGNSAKDVKGASVASSYDHSLVLFQNGVAALRRDFELTERVRVGDSP
jgi:hypothetical protein